MTEFQIERPLDLLNNLKGKEVSIVLKNEESPIWGILLAFDVHINLVVEIKKKYRFIRGEVIAWVEPNDKNKQNGGENANNKKSV